jgi:hypothetical protein
MIPLAVSLILSLAFFVFYLSIENNRYNSDDKKATKLQKFLHSLYCSIIGDMCQVLSVTFLVVGCIFAIVAPISYLTGMSRYAQLEGIQSTYSSRLNAIRIARSTTVDVESKVTKTPMVSANGLVNMQHSKPIVKMIDELMKEVKLHNRALKFYRRTRRNWFTRSFVPTVPEGLFLLSIDLQKL